jgi:hypothetical protein
MEVVRVMIDIILIVLGAMAVTLYILERRRLRDGKEAITQQARALVQALESWKP